MKKKICILSFENIDLEYRVRNQVKFLCRDYSIDLIGIGEWKVPRGVQFFQLNRTPRTIPYLIKYYILLVFGKVVPEFYPYIIKLKPEYDSAKRIIQSRDYYLIHANDWDALPIAVEGSNNKNTKILFDAHEYSPDQQSDNLIWRIFVKPYRKWLFSSYLDKIDKMVTVSESIADLYEKNFLVRNIEVIYNSKVYKYNKFRKTRKDKIKIIYQGAALPNRYIEDFFELSNYLNDCFVLHLLLQPTNKKYYKYLQNSCNFHSNSKIEILEPVIYTKLNDVIHTYDIGIPAIRSSNQNSENALGGKFFDYIMAGLAIAVTPLKSYKTFIEKYYIGIVSAHKSVKSLANEINRLSIEKIDHYKKTSLKVAKIHNWENEITKLNAIYDNLDNRNI